MQARRGKQLVTYKGIPIRLSADFSSRNFESQREWHGMFKVLKEKNARQEYFTQQSCLSELKEREFSRQAKAKGIFHH